jgi:hypothetical protein
VLYSYGSLAGSGEVVVALQGSGVSVAEDLLGLGEGGLVQRDGAGLDDGADGPAISYASVRETLWRSGGLVTAGRRSGLLDHIAHGQASS